MLGFEGVANHHHNHKSHKGNFSRVSEGFQLKKNQTLDISYMSKIHHKKNLMSVGP